VHHGVGVLQRPHHGLDVPQVAMDELEAWLVVEVTDAFIAVDQNIQNSDSEIFRGDLTSKSSG